MLLQYPLAFGLPTTVLALANTGLFGLPFPKITNGIKNLRSLRFSYQIIQSASRSPPGLASDPQNSVLRLTFSYQKCLKNKTECWPFFGALFESCFYLRGNFLSIFRPLEALWGSYGLIFGVKNCFGHQTCPKIAPRRVFPVL